MYPSVYQNAIHAIPSEMPTKHRKLQLSQSNALISFSRLSGSPDLIHPGREPLLQGYILPKSERVSRHIIEFVKQINKDFTNKQAPFHLLYYHFVHK